MVTVHYRVEIVVMQKEGKKENFINNNDLCLFQCGSNNYLHPGHGTNSAIDITKCEPELLLNFSWKNGMIYVESSLPPLDQTFNIQTLDGNLKKPIGIFFRPCFTDILMEMGNEIVPKTSSKPSRRTNPRLDDNCKKAIKDWEKSREDFQQASNKRKCNSLKYVEHKHVES